MDDAAEAHRAAAVTALLGVLGTALGVIGFWRVSGFALRVLQCVGIAINGGALLALRAQRPPYSRTLSNAIFLLVLVPTVVMTLLVDEARASHSGAWVPYEPAKLSALTLAIIAPPGWSTGVIAILMFVASTVVHHFTWPDYLRDRISAGEPFGIIAYGVFALVLLGFRQRGHAMRAELERARSEKLAMERVARVSIALRDLTNTPLQTLELVRRKLLSRDPQTPVQLERMGRALERLRRLNDVLAPYQAAVTWDHEGASAEREIASARARVSPPPLRARSN
jgi:hypothetical protein